MRKLFSWIIILFALVGFVFLSPWVAADITSTSFDINVWDITPWGTTLIWSNSEETVNNFLFTILEKILVVFWVCAAFIMTIGAGYMIIYHGQDEFLSKGKSIFTAWLIALVVALSAGLIVRLFSFLLYS